ncbi:MAG TPA: phosphatidylglycerol lysyltransferase domain-containing protein, partial [Polyangiaceae bacterium]|nr:phosphatidylglycerol lysyltransferase domain-containing protein [Polyangiaceae bacterium]
MTAPRDTDARMLAALKAHGFGAMSFSALEPGMRHWFSEADPGAAVAYVDTGSAWVAAGGPIADSTTASRVGREFVAAARRQGRRACFFAVERASLEGFSYVLLGEQPIWTPSAWPDTLARHRRLREQVRRGAGKRVRVRRVTAGDLAPGTPLRKRCDAVAGAWLASRHMAPMTFVVALEPFVCPEEHRYFVAERDGDIVAFLSAVPIYAKQGWLVEDLLRVRGAPNGTVEALIDALMREVADSAVVTLGLAPLAGP